MSESAEERWQELAKKIAEEPDPNRISRLVEELLLALGSKDRAQERNESQQSA